MEGPARLCMVCRHPKRQGVPVLAAFLCDACQHEIVALDAADPRYDVYVRRIAAFWRCVAETAHP